MSVSKEPQQALEIISDVTARRAGAHESVSMSEREAERWREKAKRRGRGEGERGSKEKSRVGPKRCPHEITRHTDHGGSPIPGNRGFEMRNVFRILNLKYKQ